jgi:hypothetical protein
MVNILLSFFSYFGAVLFALSFLLILVRAAESYSTLKQVSVITIVENIIKGFCMLVFVRYGVIFLFELSHDVATALIGGTILENTDNFKPSFLEDIVSLTGLDMKGGVLLIIAVLTIMMMYQTLKRIGIILVQIFLGYLYIPSVMSGNEHALGEWMKDLFASIVTYSLQIILYFWGMSLLNFANLLEFGECAFGLILLITAGAVPSILKKFGYSTNGSHGVTTAASVTSSLMSIARFAA